MTKTNKEKEELNRLEREERQFREKGQKTKQRVPYKRDRKNWSQVYDKDEFEEDYYK